MRYRRNDGGKFVGENSHHRRQEWERPWLGWLSLIRDITARKHAQALVQADLARLAKKHRYESIVSTVAHSVHQSTNLQDVLNNAVEAMRSHIERIDGIEIFLREGEEAVLKAYTGLPDWLMERFAGCLLHMGIRVRSSARQRYTRRFDRTYIHPAAITFGVKAIYNAHYRRGQTGGINTIRAKHALIRRVTVLAMVPSI